MKIHINAGLVTEDKDVINNDMMIEMEDEKTVSFSIDEIYFETDIDEMIFALESLKENSRRK